MQLPEPCPCSELPERFTDPFRYFPHPMIERAAREVIERIDSDPDLREGFSEGKMLGVLLVGIPSPAGNKIGYLAAFSGSVCGKSLIEGFVPPIYDLLDPAGHFKVREAEITVLNQNIHSHENSYVLTGLRSELASAEKARDEETSRAKARMAISKRERDEIRSEVSDPSRLDALIRESQYEKAELRRLKLSWEERTGKLKSSLAAMESEIVSLKAQRSRMSDELQEWIFKQYIVHNSLGEEASVMDIFSERGLVPPGGTGDCAAPKLLEYAFRHGWKPLAMGEFWYGKSPETAVRTHGHFYPSCTSKCGPLLGWMMKGMDVTDGADILRHDSDEGNELETIYEDEILLAVDKPSGMPSVPGLDGRESAYEIMTRRFGELHAVHRLDMDTSGVLLFAKTAEAAVAIQKQFENHTIRKTYKARLSAAHVHENNCRTELKQGGKGRIELSLSPDYDERPRQKVDFSQGKHAVTEYEVVSVNEDGTTDIIFHPLTGRTHQLRVHAAHILGLARPILGDPLYGGSPASRLHLHASAITFIHPLTNRETCLTSL